jgi:hypothetical protein
MSTMMHNAPRLWTGLVKAVLPSPLGCDSEIWDPGLVEDLVWGRRTYGDEGRRWGGREGCGGRGRRRARLGLGLGYASFKPHFFRTIHCQRYRWDASAVARSNTKGNNGTGRLFTIPLGMLNMIGVIVNTSPSSSAPPTPAKGIPVLLSVHLHLHRVDDKCRIQSASGLRFCLRLLTPPANRMWGIVDCLAPALSK